jgi:hypothetical protein
MKHRRLMGIFGAVATGAAVAGSQLDQVALAQDNSGSSVDLGGSIASTVSGAVSDIATNSGGTVSGGTQVQHNELSLGEQEGVAISDASGGNNNLSFVS